MLIFAIIFYSLASFAGILGFCAVIMMDDYPKMQYICSVLAIIIGIIAILFALIAIISIIIIG